ncbi:lymphokine-activated killer T-cell-originated protein kinase homolog isoform X2 [Panulirus ornatus]|uniref:lymphokine-activated killer T-cell-originated protein kinase homolog isoform X2 n=1 Tax=Panulirus ornatus TaxID=150431 RepID=UPI003A875E1A
MHETIRIWYRRIEDKKGEFTKRLSFEAEILKDLNHQNIIGYRSYTSYQDGTKCLAMESGEKSLADIIEVRQEEGLGPFSSQQILKVARDISSALTYLHEEKNLLHGDLKSANILIKGDFEIAKLCDFGVTLKLNDKGVASIEDGCYVGTECWSAPEALVGAVITYKTDIFSFGLVVWEMLSLSPPHVDKLSFNETKDAEDTGSLDDETDEYFKALGTRPALPNIEMSDDYLPVLEIFYACTESEQARRPSAKQVLDILCSIEDQKKKTENLENTCVKSGIAEDK